MARAGRRDEALLSSIERLVVASLPGPRQGLAGGVRSTSAGALIGVLPGTPGGGLLLGVGGKLVPVDSQVAGPWAIRPSASSLSSTSSSRAVGRKSTVQTEVAARMPSVSDGTARLAIGTSASVVSDSTEGPILDKQTAGRLLRGFHDLMYK